MTEDQQGSADFGADDESTEMVSTVQMAPVVTRPWVRCAKGICFNPGYMLPKCGEAQQST